ncbi:CAI-1 autoinducer synthase [Nocardia tenerifensis]|uniref:8-amino-7-oxononanoate synthase n=1 Tax=Nocardia tenerifensis TaxID=228006 RepID=A0A318JQD5_9NOCA|nr:alpha-hydroxyketone-type quorum-sensing autoinducer synthase [Nocardia tenerifensis]PXX56319.1 CAI-1 autoinducer synthase [Nocardia tenerifensis]
MATGVADRIRRRVERFHTERVAGEWGGRHILHGNTPAPGDVLVNSNDYLAVARDPRVTAAIRAALVGCDGGLLASGVFQHGDHPQIALESALAQHMRASAGILCQSGWDANVGLMQSIADSQTPVYVDHIAHMSLWHGAKVAGARVHPFRHNSIEHLRGRIRAHGPGIIAVDSIYSTNGSRCPLPEMCEVAEETASVLLVDESHSLGIDGPSGAGTVVALGLAERVPFRVVSLSKAFAGRAGFIATNNPEFVDYFKMESEPAVFSSTLLPHDIAGLGAALAVIRADDWRRRRLDEVSATLREAMTALGFDLENSASHIVSLQTGPDLRAMAIRDFLERRGIFGSVFCPPATSRHRTLIRFSMHANLTDVDVDRIIDSCADIRSVFGATRSAARETVGTTNSSHQTGEVIR